MEKKNHEVFQQLIIEGKNLSARGEKKAGHAFFLKALRLEPENVSALIYAAGTSEFREQAETFLHRARNVQPDYPGIDKGMRWAAKLPSRKPSEFVELQQPDSKSAIPKTEVIDSKRSGKRKLWIVALVLFLLLIIVIAGLRYLPGELLNPVTDQLADIVFRGEINAPTISMQEGLPATWTPQMTDEKKVLATETIVTTSTATPFLTATRDTHGLPLVELSDKNYPLVNVEKLYDSPEEYEIKRLRIFGRILDFRSVPSNGELRFLVLLEPSLQKGEESAPLSPIMVLDLPLDEGFSLGVEMMVYGIGGGLIEEAESLDDLWFGPLVYGEFYELK
ncbi:MAG: hypothetical protein JEZ06_19375 [Anaerolineaceae bacterium]|nr:hypothetical protein [Anaerolineaceae bacterium]